MRAGVWEELSIDESRGVRGVIEELSIAGVWEELGVEY